MESMANEVVELNQVLEGILSNVEVLNSGIVEIYRIAMPLGTNIPHCPFTKITNIIDGIVAKTDILT